jgi:N-glycosidase YbiA
MACQNVIDFYSRMSNRTYYDLSNFGEATFIYMNRKWKTSEHAFQAMKFAYDEKLHPYVDKIMNASTPAEAKRLGGNHSVPIDPRWDLIRDDYMYEIIYEKFTQNENLRQLLIGTGDAILREASPTDEYWGIGRGNGKNTLGILLMRLREKLRQK